MVQKASQTPEGCFVEVGVYKGGSASHLTELAEQQNRKIFLYDTFSGMPFADDVDFHKVGEFADGVDYESIKKALPYAEIIKGIFPESMVEMPAIAFAHVDVDQYKSYIDCINILSPKMIKGGVMWFDDYELEGAKKAIDELIDKNDLIFAKCGHKRAYVKF